MGYLCENKLKELSLRFICMTFSGKTYTLQTFTSLKTFPYYYEN